MYILYTYKSGSYKHVELFSFWSVVGQLDEKAKKNDTPWKVQVYVGLSPLPVIVEMKVYRDSLLKME